MTNEETAAEHIPAALVEPVDTGPTLYTHGTTVWRIEPVEAPLEPLSDRVLVRKLPKVAKVSVGDDGTPDLILPEIAQEEQHAGIVIAVGPGRYSENGTLIPIDVQFGDQVHFPTAAGYQVGEPDDDTWMMTQDDCLGVRRGGSQEDGS